MDRVSLDLTNATDREKVNCVLRRAIGLVPGEPNQGLVAELEGSPARLADYDDSGWEVVDDIRVRVSTGFAFCWWRFTIELPELIDGEPIAGARVIFETNIDDYGELYVDSDIDKTNGTVAGFNRPQRVTISTSAVPGTKHVIACLAANGPFAAPFGGVFMRLATLAFETPTGFVR